MFTAALTVALALALQAPTAWEVRPLLLAGDALGVATPDAPARAVVRVVDFAVVDGGAWRAIVVDDQGATAIVGAATTQAAFAVEPALPGWHPVDVDVSLEGDRLTTYAKDDAPDHRAVHLNAIVLAETGAPLAAPFAPAGATWSQIDAALVTDDHAALVVGMRSEPGSSEPRPTLALISGAAGAPELLVAYDQAGAALAALPAAPGLVMNDLGHVAFTARVAPEMTLMVIDEAAVLRSGGSAPWPFSAFALVPGDPVALNHQLEWALVTAIQGQGAKRRAIIKNGAAFVLHGKPAQLLSGSSPVQLFLTAPLYLSDNSNLFWLGQGARSTALFREKTCLLETGQSQVTLGAGEAVTLATIDTGAVGFEVTRDGERAVFLGTLSDGARGLFVAQAAR